jgi:Flp pilus assembly protein TadG
VVEAAVILPIFFLFVFGIFEAGRFMSEQQAVADAAREGARFAVAPLSGTNALPLEAAVDATVQQFLSAAGISGSTITYDNSVLGADGTTYTRVHIDVPYNIFTTTDFNMMNVTLHGDAVMRNETSD